MKQPETYGIAIENENFSDRYGFTPDTEERKAFFRQAPPNVVPVARAVFQNRP